MKFLNKKLPKKKKKSTKSKSIIIKKPKRPAKKQIHEQGHITTSRSRELMRWFVLQKIFLYFVQKYTEDIEPAGISTSPRHVATKSVLQTIGAIPVGLTIGIILALFILPNILPTNLAPHVGIISPLLVVLLSALPAVVVFFSKRFSLRDIIKKRAKTVESELFFFTVYCDVMEKTGKGLRGAFEIIRNEGGGNNNDQKKKNKKNKNKKDNSNNNNTSKQLFPAMFREACIIHRETKVFSKNFVDIIRDMGLSHPSDSFKDFLRGYLISQESGGTGAGVFLHEKLREYHVAAQQKLTAYGNTSEMLATVGSFGLVMFPIFVVVGGIIMPPSTLLLMCVFGILLIPGMIAFLIKTAAKANPIQPPKLKPPKIPLMVAGSLGAMLLLLSLLVIVPTQEATTIMTTSENLNDDKITARTAALTENTGPPALPLSSWWELIALPLIIWCTLNFTIARGNLGQMAQLEKSIPDFIRDINQKTKSNPSFHAAFNSAESTAPYSKQFNQTLHQIKSRLQFGINMATALSEVQTGSWLYNCTMKLMAHAVRAGSVTPAVLDRLSMFASHYLESRKELSAKTATPLMTGYMGSIIVVMMILMIPVSSFDASLSSLTGGANSNVEIVTNPGDSQIAGFDPQTLLNELNLVLVVVGAFCSMLLISQIRYGTILHSMHTAVLLVVISSIFYYERYVGIAGFGGI